MNGARSAWARRRVKASSASWAAAFSARDGQMNCFRLAPSLSFAATEGT